MVAYRVGKDVCFTNEALVGSKYYVNWWLWSLCYPGGSFNRLSEIKAVAEVQKRFWSSIIGIEEITVQAAKMKMGIFIDITEVNTSLNLDLKQERGVSGGL